MPKSKLTTILNASKEAPPITVSDIPVEALDEILESVGFPKKSGKNMQTGWPRTTRLDKRTLQDFAAGAATESDPQAK